MATVKSANRVFVLAMSIGLAACGGGGSSGSGSTSGSPINSVGIWSGRTDTNPPDFPLIVVRPTGEAWIFNSDAFSIQGFGLLTLSESGNSNQSTSGKYFSSRDGLLQISMEGTALKDSSFGGTFRFSSLNGSTTYSTTFVNSSNLNFTPIARTWDVGSSFTLAIQSTGAFSASDTSGCQINGNINPTNEGYSIGTVTAATNSSCRIASTSLTGLLYSNGGSIWMALVPPSKDNSYLFYSRVCSNNTTYPGVDFTWSCM